MWPEHESWQFATFVLLRSIAIVDVLDFNVLVLFQDQGDPRRDFVVDLVGGIGQLDEMLFGWIVADDRSHGELQPLGSRSIGKLPVVVKVAFELEAAD